jgi:flagellin
MPAVLNTNVASLRAAGNLLGAQEKLASSVERLSSGLRINRAKDDAAGLGVANSLTRQINGANQGIRNLNDGISMVQTAEAAISAAMEMGQRVLMLATQGANGTLGVTERTAIRTELRQLLTAIDAISSRTKYSGNSLLSADARTSAGTATPSTSALYSLQTTDVTTDKIDLATAAFINIGGSSGLVGTAITGSAGTGTTSLVMKAGSAQPTTVVGSNVYKKIADGTYTSIGSVASLSADGLTVTLAANNAAALAVDDVVVFSGQLTQKHSSTANDLSLSEIVADRADTLISSTSSTATDRYQMAIRAASGFVTALGTQRGLLGAYQNQIEYTVSNVTELSSNLTSARSRVTDTDYAAETAALTKGQILQQAATAMLAQANQMPNVILTLLK